MADENDWAKGIVEEYRMDRRILNFISHDSALYFSELEVWERFVDLKFTKHAMQRLTSYVGKISEKPWEGKEYIEVYPQEFEYLKKLTNIQSLFQYAKRVELGLTRYGKVCKVSYVLDLTVHCPQLYSNRNDEKRWLFLCIGVDGSIKTMNITPEEKRKDVYGGKIEYITMEDVYQWVLQ
jgi:hypothetical protein